jgi:lipopolysaccharide export system permease protein
MKILDRYAYGLYWSAFAVFILAFLLLYVLIDLVGRANDFLDLPTGNRILFCLQYYLVRIPMFLTILFPIVTLFAAMFTCHRLAKANEFIPMVSAGVSLRRVTAPFFAAGALVAAANAAMEEWILPSLGTWIVRTENVLRRGDHEYNLFVRDATGNTFYFFQYTYSNFEGRRAFAALFGPDRKIQSLITAERAVCEQPPSADHATPGIWRFYGGTITKYRPNLERNEGAALPPEGYRLETDLDPANLARGERVGTTFLSMAQLLELIEDNPQMPLFAVRLQSRLASPLVSLLLLLIGIPFIAVMQRQNLFIGVGACILICGGYYVIFFLCLDGGVRGELSPALAGWLPNLLFGSFGSWLFFSRLKT